MQQDVRRLIRHLVLAEILIGGILLAAPGVVRWHAYPLAGTRWQLFSMTTADGTWIPQHPTFFTLMFRDGTLSGSAGCNGFSGPYRMGRWTASFDTGAVGKGASACHVPELVTWEWPFFHAVVSANRYTQTEQQLALYNDDEGSVVIFVRQAENP